MASQQSSRWDNVANDPSVTFQSGGSIYRYGGTEYHHAGRSSHGSRFAVPTPGPRAARPLNEATFSALAVQAASMRLQSRLSRGEQDPDPGYDLGTHTCNQDGHENPLGLNGQAPLRHQYQDNASPWVDYSLQSQDNVIQPHARTGFHCAFYIPNDDLLRLPPCAPHSGPLYREPDFRDRMQDNIYHDSGPCSQTSEEFRHGRHVYSRARLDPYRVYDEGYNYGDPRTRLHGQKGRYGDERRYELHLPWDEF